MLKKSSFLLLSGSLLTGVSAQASVIWNSHSDGELHQYMVVYFQDTWEAANAHVGTLGEGWHLATVTSAEEQEFLTSFLYSTVEGRKFWLGGYQDDDATEHAEGWNWVTGEVWDYTNWAWDQPDDYNGRDQSFLVTAGSDWTWDDQTIDMNGLGRITGYFAERSGQSVHVPEPGTLALMGAGLLGLGFLRRRTVAGSAACPV